MRRGVESILCGEKVVKLAVVRHALVRLVEIPYVRESFAEDAQHHHVAVRTVAPALLAQYSLNETTDDEEDFCQPNRG